MVVAGDDGRSGVVPRLLCPKKHECEAFVPKFEYNDRFSYETACDFCTKRATTLSSGGVTWYRCILCNYDLCDECSKDALQKTPGVRTSTSSTSIAAIVGVGPSAPSRPTLVKGNLSSGVPVTANSGLDLAKEVQCGPTPKVLSQIESTLKDPKWVSPTNGQTLMFLAASRSSTLGGALEIAQKLADLKVPVNFQDDHRQTALYYAAREGNADCVAFLVEGKCDPNHQDVRGQTALFYACRHGRVKSCQMLVGSGANANLKDNFGVMAFDLAPKDNQKALKFLKASDPRPATPNAASAVQAPAATAITAGKKVAATSIGHPSVSGRKTIGALTASDEAVLQAVRNKKRKLAENEAEQLAASTSPTPPQTQVPSGGSSSSSAPAPVIAAAKAPGRKGIGREALEAFVKRGGPSAEHAQNMAMVQMSNELGRAAKANESLNNSQNVLATAVCGNQGTYCVTRPRIADVLSLRSLEREFVQDHCGLFKEEARAAQLTVTQWCEVVNVIHNEAEAMRAISSIVKGQTSQHMTLQCLHCPRHLTDGKLHDLQQATVVGYIHYVDMDGHIEASHLKVKVEHQKRGIGGLLLAGMAHQVEKTNTAASPGEQRGLRHMSLVVMSRNHTAIRLYKALGFEECGHLQKPMGKTDGKISWTRMRRLPKRDDGTSEGLVKFRKMCEERAGTRFNTSSNVSGTGQS